VNDIRSEENTAIKIIYLRISRVDCRDRGVKKEMVVWRKGPRNWVKGRAVFGALGRNNGGKE
jgi:hypothetical protein